MRVLGVDYGTKHTGLALGENKNTVSLTSVATSNLEYLVEQILKEVEKEKINLIVVGLPLHTNPKQQNITQKFIELLKSKVSIDVLTVDEKGTSKQAFEEDFTKHSAIKKQKKTLHSKSAEKILENYFLATAKT